MYKAIFTILLSIMTVAAAVARVCPAANHSESLSAPISTTATGTLKVAVLLPFSLSKDKMTPERQKMLDFYRGVLMTIDSLKQTGQSVEVTAIDEGPADDSQITTALQNPLLKESDIIIGPGRNADVNAVAAFAQLHHIPLVIPFANTPGLTGGRPYVFQCNPQVSSHYSKVIGRFAASHSTDNIIFVGMNDKSDDANYIIAFKKHLENKGIRYSRCSFAELDEQFSTLLNGSHRNLIIPSATSASSFEMLCLKLNDLKLQNYDIQLLGYPEWQTMHAKNHKNMSRFNATFFCTFYNNNVSSRTQSFCKTFETNFQQPQYEGWPRYGEMGHDISAFFLTALQRYGSSITEHIGSHGYNSLQLPMKFVRSGEGGGFVNSALYQVTYKPDGNIILTPF